MSAPVDIGAMRAMAVAGRRIGGDDEAHLAVSLRWLEQVAAELEAGRAAQEALAKIDAHIGETFGGLKL